MERIANFTANTFSSLKIKNYRLYFAGQAVSQCGTWMQSIGQAWLVLKMTGSGTQLGLVSAAQFLPVLLFGPWGGVVADRFDKRKVVIFTQCAFAVLALTLGILVATGAVRLWMVYVLASGIGILSAIDTPTRQTFVHDIVGKDHLQNAISLNSTLFNFSRIIGPAIAGSLIATVGIAPCFLLNAISYVAVIVGLSLMNMDAVSQSVPIEHTSGQLISGFKYIFSQPKLRDLLIIMAIVGTFVYEFQVSIPLLAEKTFLGDARVYAALTSAMGLGSVLGGLWAANRGKPKFKSALQGIFILTIGMTFSAISPNYLLALIGMAVVGFASTVYTSQGNTTLQLNSQPQMRGRVLALWNTALIGSTPIGGPIIGFIGEHLNPRWALGAGALSSAIAWVYGVIAKKKQTPVKI